MSAITRSNEAFKAIVPSGDTTSSMLPLSNFAWGSIQLPEVVDSSTFTWELSNGTFWSKAIDSFGIRLASTPVVLGGVYPIPLEIMGAQGARLVFDSAESADRVLLVNLKG